MAHMNESEDVRIVKTSELEMRGKAFRKSPIAETVEWLSVERFLKNGIKEGYSLCIPLSEATFNRLSQVMKRPIVSFSQYIKGFLEREHISYSAVRVDSKKRIIAVDGAKRNGKATAKRPSATGVPGA